MRPAAIRLDRRRSAVPNPPVFRDSRAWQYPATILAHGGSKGQRDRCRPSGLRSPSGDRGNRLRRTRLFCNDACRGVPWRWIVAGPGTPTLSMRRSARAGWPRGLPRRANDSSSTATKAPVTRSPAVQIRRGLQRNAGVVVQAVRLFNSRFEDYSGAIRTSALVGTNGKFTANNDARHYCDKREGTMIAHQVPGV